MGVIEDGSVSGFLPSNGAFAVHYPAYPSSMARAIETLGGTQAIRKVRSLSLSIYLFFGVVLIFPGYENNRVQKVYYFELM